MFTDIMGTKIYYETAGPEGAPPVVLLHGWGCDTRLMRPVADGLKDDHRVLLLDFPGHGQSGKPPVPWGVPEYAACLRALLEQQGFVPCDAVAHSFGCRVAAYLASEDPAVFRRLVLTGAAGLKKPQTEEARKRGEKYRKEKALAQKLGRVPGLGKLSDRLTEQVRRKYGSADYNALAPDMRETFVRVISLDLRDRYPLIRQSTLLVWGSEDTETPLWMGQEMEKLIPDAGLVVLEGGSHFAYMEQIGRFRAILRAFL